MSRLARIATIVLSTILLAALVAGCSSAGTGIKVTGAWARASSAMAAAGAAYLTIQNTGSAADALVGVTSPASTTAEVHETVVLGSAAPSPSGGMGMGSPMPSASGGTGGMMGMQPMPRLEIPAGGIVELKPGSYHIMLIGLTGDLTVGGKIELTLMFEHAGAIKVSAEVRAN